MLRAYAGIVGFLVLVAASAQPLIAQDSSAVATPSMARWGSEFMLPLGSTVAPGLGQYIDGAHLAGAAYTGTAAAGLVAGFAIAGREPGVEYEPFRARDAVFSGALAYNAGVGEEALLRGWLLPMVHQQTGRRFWLADALQAGDLRRAARGCRGIHPRNRCVCALQWVGDAEERLEHPRGHLPALLV